MALVLQTAQLDVNARTSNIPSLVLRLSATAANALGMRPPSSLCHRAAVSSRASIFTSRSPPTAKARAVP